MSLTHYFNNSNPGGSLVQVHVLSVSDPYLERSHTWQVTSHTWGRGIDCGSMCVQMNHSTPC